MRLSILNSKIGRSYCPKPKDEVESNLVQVIVADCIVKRIYSLISLAYLLSPSNGKQSNSILGRELWSSGYGRRLMFQRLWVRIPAPYTVWTFFTYLFVEKFVICVWKDENKWKRGRDWPILEQSNSNVIFSFKWGLFQLYFEPPRLGT